MPRFQLFTSPPDPAVLIRNKYALLKELRQKKPALEKNIAILGGSTTTELRDLLEIFLLACGIRPRFYESDFNRLYEDALFGTPELDTFKPDVVYLHTTVRNIEHYPAIGTSKGEAQELAIKTVNKITSTWKALSVKFNCTIIQNNFDPPPHRVLGNLDSTAHCGGTRFIKELNIRLADEALACQGIIIHDIDRLAAETGLTIWHDPNSWHAYKCSPGLSALPRLAHSLAAILRTLFGKSSKCLVLDLDHTLWGGIIGDDGVDGIKLGRETPQGEAYLSFQQYVKALKNRGVLLAVCSKNEETSALEGLRHPDSALAPEDFTLIRANWEPKSRNIDAIAREINIGRDALVFFDDNPAEREIVSTQLPDVAVLDPGQDVASYITALDISGLFEIVTLSDEDLSRSRYYVENARRSVAQAEFGDYGQYLDSLEMKAEIAEFVPQYLDRITLLTNKTNQFNLTTRRFTLPEIAAAAKAPDVIPLYGRLVDKFGDNGVVSVMLGAVHDDTVSIELWLMSCRVFKREMELAMFDEFIRKAKENGLMRVIGHHVPTAKNAIVADLYAKLGFSLTGTDEDGTTHWSLAIADNHTKLCSHIKVNNGLA